jgi:hypothetical protein
MGLLPTDTRAVPERAHEASALAAYGGICRHRLQRSEQGGQMFEGCKARF